MTESIIERGNGYLAHRMNNILHRLDGPAVEWDNGGKMWFVNGLRHRLDGPAREYPDGTKWWWVDGQQIVDLKLQKI